MRSRLLVGARKPRRPKGARLRVPGQGLAEEMTRDALADLKRRGLKAQPLCPYVVAYARRHPDEL